MSTPAADFDSAYARHLGATYDQVLFRKLAAVGYAPRTEAEAARIRDMGARIYGLHQEKAAQAAALQPSFLDYAASYLDGLDGGVKRAAAAEHFAADPAVLENAAVLAALLDSRYQAA